MLSWINLKDSIDLLKLQLDHEKGIAGGVFYDLDLV